MSVARRIYQGLGANAFGQIITIAIQLISVPILISIWGIEKYGEWIVISAIPAYLAFSDLGLTSASANKVAILFERERFGVSQRIYQTCFVLVTLLSVIITCLIAILGTAFNFVEILNIKNFTHPTFLYLSIGLIVHVVLAMQTNVYLIPFRAVKKTPKSTFILNTTRLLEWSAALTAVTYSQSAEALVLTLIVTRLIANILIFAISTNITPHLNVLGGGVDKKAARVLIRPALASMAFPIGLALTIQGATILISIFVGGAGVALFSIYRTLTRLVIQAVTVINQSIWPELSYAYAKNNNILIKEIINRTGKISLYGCTIFILAIYLCSDFLIRLWIGPDVIQDKVLLILMLAATLLHVLWQRFWVFLMATNNHLEFSKIFLMITFFTFIIHSFLASSFGLYGSAASLIICEALCGVYSRKYFYLITEKQCSSST